MAKKQGNSKRKGEKIQRGPKHSAMQNHVSSKKKLRLQVIEPCTSSQGP
jgi:hypothetical protein